MHKGLSQFEEDQFVMARRLGQFTSKTAALLGCSWFAVVSIYQKWSKEGRKELWWSSEPTWLKVSTMDT